MKIKLADKLGSEYAEVKLKLDEYSRIKDSVSGRIKRLAQLSGVAHGKRLTLKGDRYEVGFVKKDGRTALNASRLKELLKKRPKVWLAITEPAINSERLELAVRRGWISREELRSCLETSPPTESLFVKELPL